MAKRARTRQTDRPEQLLLFAEHVSLARIRPALDEWCHYPMELSSDLFGRVVLLRQWGRIGTAGHHRLDPYPDPGAALNALARIADAKRRRGYRDRSLRRCPAGTWLDA